MARLSARDNAKARDWMACSILIKMLLAVIKHPPYGINIIFDRQFAIQSDFKLFKALK